MACILSAPCGTIAVPPAPIFIARRVKGRRVAVGEGGLEILARAG